jgi:L-arabinose isomerase
VHTLKAMALGRPGGTSFMEDYTYHFGPGQPKVLGAHMLEVCPSITSSAPRVEIHALSIGARNDPVRLVFTADPGAGIVVGLADLGERFRLVLNAIDLVGPDEPMPKLPVAHAVWTPRPDMPTALESWLKAGGPHHTALSTSVGVDAVADLAEILRTELVIIDEHTTTRAFANELRWNQAYFRLAQGL